MSIISQDILQYYQERKKNFGLTAQGVGYKNLQAQDVTFTQLTHLIEEQESFSVNDIGCGFGNLLDFMVSRFHNFQYRGYDVLPEMIEASQQLHQAKPFASFHHIDGNQDLISADYSIGAGIFNLKFSTPEHEWLSYILKTIDALNRYSVKGFAFNILTKYSDKEFMKPQELYYADPLFFFDYCKRNYSRDIALLHDYTLYEFTIIVRKR
jgi:SAM-dependent methyltransferase